MSLSKKIIEFIKYNNATIIIVVIIFVFGGGVFASETGREALGQRETNIEGTDNTVLLAADLDNFDMDFRIEKIEEDEDYYYVTYTFIDLLEVNQAWQYQLMQKVRKVSKNIDMDLGEYLAEELGEEYQARIKELKKIQTEAREQGETKREEVIKYSGLIGRALNAGEKIFPNYSPEKRKTIASPSLVSLENYQERETTASLPTDDLTQVYHDYVADHLDDVMALDSPGEEISNADNNKETSGASDDEVAVAEGDVAGEEVAPEDENIDSQDTGQTSEEENSGADTSQEPVSEEGAVEIIELPQSDNSSSQETGGDTAVDNSSADNNSTDSGTEIVNNETN